MATIFGDTSANLTDHQKAKSQTITVTQDGNQTVFGDANQFFDFVQGGNDTITGSYLPNATFFNEFVGDAGSLRNNSIGGNDVITGASSNWDAFANPLPSNNILIGDAANNLFDNAKGGNDTLIGGHGVFSNVLYGDAGDQIGGNALGGNDYLLAAVDSAINVLYGDAGNITGNARGGNDVLIGGSLGGGETLMIGDAFFMTDNAKGGNDTLIAGPFSTQMWGDAEIISDRAKGGADIFKPSTAEQSHLEIADFRQIDHDKLDLSGFGFTDITQFTQTTFVTGNNSPELSINVGGSSTIVLDGLTAPLVASDFIFFKPT